MRKSKFLIYLRLYWSQILIISILLSLTIFVIFMMYYGVNSLFMMEAFSRRQLIAMMSVYLMIFLIVGVFQSIIFGFVNMYFVAGGGLERLGQKRINAAKVNVKWHEVIGMDAPKKEAWEIVQLLKDRRLLQAIGGKIVKGTMMVGPPGCGKTYLAKAIATEADLPFLSTVGSEFVGIFVGTGAQRMKTLFKEARALADIHGGCIIFIDEVDSFARPRQAEHGFGAATSHNATVNQFLTELDGLRQQENNIVVIAATNVPEEELDSAIMRAGRFDRKIYIDKPTLEERKAIFKFYLSRVKTDPTINIDILARKALWFTPADIDNMVREAGLIAMRENRVDLSMKDLSAAYDRVMFGLKSNVTLNEKEKVWTAYHEAGHAVIAYLTHPTNDVIKATIVPHKGSLGFISQRPIEEQHMTNREHLLASIKVSVASYVAEQIKFGTTSSGVGGGTGSDFDTAIKIAHSMVWRYGMGKSGLVGDFHSLISPYGQSYFSEKTKEILDQDVQDILQTCINDVRAILQDKKELLEYFAQELLKKEELEYDDIEAIFQKFNLRPASRPLG